MNEDEVLNWMCDDGWGSNPLAVTPVPTAPAPVAVEKSKTTVVQDKQLTAADWEFVKTHKPDLAWEMLKRGFNIKKDFGGFSPYVDVPRSWLESNCTGFYHLPNSERVLFENDEDAVLFKMTFEGRPLDDVVSLEKISPSPATQQRQHSEEIAKAFAEKLMKGYS